MAHGSFILRQADNAGVAVPDLDAEVLEWPILPGSTTSVVSDLGWNLAPLAGVSVGVCDLLHVATAAYIADRRTARGTRFGRDLSIHVSVLAEAWTSDLIGKVEALLGWLTGDHWTLTIEAAPEIDLPIAGGRSGDVIAPVSLLSGGLDSFMGAIYLHSRGELPLFLGHKDTATSIRSAQNMIERWLADSYTPVPSYTRLVLHQGADRIESSSRSRSLLFLALGIATAASVGASTLIVPENGYTGINLPLRPNRGGALSTRSTHPETFDRVASIVKALDIPVSIRNPFEWMTKGEAMRMIRDSTPPDGWITIAGKTMSCSKLNGNWYGGSPNLNCGLCVPCMVRRATFLKAQIPDSSRYLFAELSGAKLDELVNARRGDIEAVRYAIEAGVDTNAIESGTWPADYDLDRVQDLVTRGLAELALLELP
ncbi:queuosine biosynthesis protein queC (plasmid) [Rhodococcus qingshengii]|uniref:queuosine biosynthesis protein queC n=1 Tax=Rhodococcus qingshengii TaxID=334542 RepID=UPI001E2EAEC6|nr:queuosine biosynthesis protein queC [Rhodococcus qingshengii]UGQ55402.1 queuosine biosynthesis protein queC [Rhodococcus qingshengii]